MLDVVLYGYDGRGLLTLEERSFPNLKALARFFSLPGSARWEWAEVEITPEPGRREIAHYSADALRGMIMASSLAPSMN